MNHRYLYWNSGSELQKFHPASPKSRSIILSTNSLQFTREYEGERLRSGNNFLDPLLAGTLDRGAGTPKRISITSICFGAREAIFENSPPYRARTTLMCGSCPIQARKAWSPARFFPSGAIQSYCFAKVAERYTRRSQKPMRFTPHEGSSPSLGTDYDDTCKSH